MADETNQMKGRGAWVAASVAIVLALAVAGLVFANSISAGRTIDEAAALRAADRSLAAQDVAMKSIAQLVLLGQDSAIGVASVETVAVARDEAERSIDEFVNRTAELDDPAAGQIGPAIEMWFAVGEEVVGLAMGDRPNAAATLLVDELVPLSETLADDLIDERDARVLAVDDAKRWVGTMARFAGFITAVLLPLLAMIAYRRSMKRQLQVTEAHLEARLEAEESVGRSKDQFIANLAHELHTPLTSIHGYSENLLAQGVANPVIAEDLAGRINAEVAELAWMVEDLLVAAHDDDAPLVMDISSIAISEEIDTVMRLFGRRGIEIGGTHAVGQILGDRLRVHQILRNLVSNTLEHGVETIRIFGDVAGGNYVIAVEDDGDSVGDDVASRLSGRSLHWDKTTLTAGSVGRGLAVAHRLAEAMGGSLDYERVAGRTSFVLGLPLADPSGDDVTTADLATTSV